MGLVKHLSIALFASAMATSAGASTVINGSFEDLGTGVLNGSGWNIFSDVPGWTGDPNVEIQSNPTLGTIDAQDGQYYAELDTNQDGGIYQDIFLSAGNYLLSFWYSPRVNASPTSTNDMEYSISGGLLDGSIDGAPNLSYPHGVWTEVTGLFSVATESTVRLSFFATGGSLFSGCGNCGALIDNVSISPASSGGPTVVPIPAAFPLLAGSFGLLGLLGWCRKKQQA